MPKIPVVKHWKDFDDDAADNWIAGSYSNVRQPTSARTMENLAQGVNHLQALTPRPMFGASIDVDQADKTGADPLHEWRYEDSVYNGVTYRITVVGLPRSTSNTGNAWLAQWNAANHYDAGAIGQNYTANAVASIDAFQDAFFEEIDVNRAAALNAFVNDGVSTFNGYTAIHVGVQELPRYTLSTIDNILCDPALAKKGGKILADAASGIRSTLHNLRSTNLPIVFSYSGKQAWSHTNVTPANLFDTSVAARSADSPGAMYDAQYCARGDLSYRAQANVKVYCSIKAALTAGDATPCNVYFVGPLDTTTISIAPGSDAWHGNTDHFIYLDANAGPTWGNVGANKIDVLASVNAAGDSLTWQRVRCWIDYE